jgi:hypothetical protein
MSLAKLKEAFGNDGDAPLSSLLRHKRYMEIYPFIYIEKGLARKELELNMVLCKSKEDLEYSEEHGHMMYVGSGRHEFKVTTCTADDQAEFDEFVEGWYNTADLPRPDPMVPVVQDIIDLPVLSTRTIGEVAMAFDDDVLFDIQYSATQSIYEEHPDVKIEKIMQYTTEYGKYGQEVYRLAYFGKVFGFLTSSGKYLDTYTAYILDEHTYKCFCTMLENEYWEKDEWTGTAELTPDSPLTFLSDQLLDALAEGDSIDQTH